MSFKKIGIEILNALTWKDEDYFLDGVVRGDIVAVQPLVAKGVDLEARYSDGFTPLMAAISHGHLGIAQLLLDKGGRQPTNPGSARFRLSSVSSV
ncbi:MAG: ankyrin repeat domain-containing protein [Thermoanaerobaculia bacterium]|nr:ankyrin repeat domain-containing protein [Thermoanaerobaculia bacterium]